MVNLPTFGQNIVQQPPPSVGNDIPICFGNGDEFCWVFDTSDPDAHLLMGDMPPGGAVNVPVVVIGIGISGQDLVLFDGLVQPQYGVVDRDLDAAVILGFIDDDAPAIQFRGNSNGLMVAFGAGAPPADQGLHLWFATAGAVAARSDSGLTLEHTFQGVGRSMMLLGPRTETQQAYLFGDEDDTLAAGFLYSHADDRMSVRIGGANRILITATNMDFLQTTTITALGNMTLTPTGDLILGATLEVGQNIITNVQVMRGRSGSELLLRANQRLTDPTAQRILMATIDTVGDTQINVAYAVPTATETTPFWAQRADITVPIAAALDANFLTFRWNESNDEVSVFVNDGGTIRTVVIGTVT